MDYLSTAASGLYYIVYPIVFVFGLLLYVLNIVTAPLQHLAHYVLYACWYLIALINLEVNTMHEKLTSF